jgi:hypothetical protein
MIKYIIILFIIIIFYLIIIKIYYFNIIFNNKLYIKLNQIDNYIKTGDIILFRYNKINFIHELVSPFTHIGIIILYNNKSYILESHIKGDTLYLGYNNEGVNIYNLYDRLNKYEGTTFLLKLNQPLSNKSINNLINNISKYKNIPYINNYKKYYFNKCINIFYNNQLQINDGMICSELISYILQDINDNNILNYKCIKPVDFLYNNLYEKQFYKIIN